MPFIKTNKKRLLSTLTLAGSLAACLTVSSAQAGIINTFTDRTAWEAAVGAGNFVTEEFNVANNVQLDPSNVFPSLVNDVGAFNVFYTTSGGVNETGNVVVNSTGSRDGGLRQDDYLQLVWDTFGTDSTTALELRFDSAVNAFAANFVDIHNSGLSLTLDGTAVNLYAALGGSGNIANGFLGWTLDNAVSSMAFFSASGGDTFQMDNVSLGNVSAVPVPAAVWLMGSALIGLAGFRRKKA